MISEKAMIALARLFTGGAIFIASMVTGVDGQAQLIALFLMGFPIEALQNGKKTKEEQAEESA